MFHGGELQSGIAAAVQQSKAVLCYIYDNSELSQKWENDFFQDQEAANLVRSHSVALKIEYGSLEANHLKALCPIPSAPMGIIIKDGRIEAIIQSQHSKEEFLGIIQRKLGNEVSSSTEKGTSAAATTSQRINSVPQRPDTVAPLGGEEDNSVAQATPTSASLAPATSSASLKTGSSATAQAAANEIATQSETSKMDSQRQEYIAQQRQREAAQRAERQRIKESIEADRRERRRQVELARKGPSNQETVENGPSTTALQPPTEVRLAVRLLSGQSIRSTFSRSATLSNAIRPWVTEQLRQLSPSDANTPYTFKLVLAPHPNRTISISEEEMTLEELLSGEETGRGRGGVNFILVPEKSYTEAYGGGPGSSVIGLPVRAVSNGYGLISSVAGGIYTTFSTFLRVGAHVQGENRSDADAQSGSPSSTDQQEDQTAAGGNVKIRTLADQRAEAEKRRNDEQWYNGNQTNFVPKRRDEGDDRKRE